MAQGPDNRFDDFFVEPAYLSLKNHLYNYQVRKRAVRERLPRQVEGMTLEVGSGISPISPATDRTVFTELSFSALRCLKAGQGAGHYVVADATRLPFKEGVFRTCRLFRGPRAHRGRPRGRRPDGDRPGRRAAVLS